MRPLTLHSPDSPKFVLGGLAWILALCVAQGAAAVSIGQVDTFEDGTTQGWVVSLLGNPHPAPPANVATGGPAGDGDNYLRLTSNGGFGAGNRLVVINPAQWAGNYQAAGITAIRMDVINLGATDLQLRLYFEDPMGGPPSNAASSSVGVALPAGSGWTSIELPIGLADLTSLLGTTSDALSTTTALRIFHGSNALFPPEPIAAQLGVDNIRAVPEPGVALLLGIGLAGLATRRRR